MLLNDFKILFQELYIAQEKSLSEELRKRDERISELEQVQQEDQCFSDSDEDEFKAKIRELDEINEKYSEVSLPVSGLCSPPFNFAI